MDAPLDLAAEIAKLRRDNLKIKVAGGLLAIILFALLAVCRFQPLKTVEGNEFLLKDSVGNVFAKLGPYSGGTCLTLNAKGHAADAELCVSDDESSFLRLSNKNGDSQVLLSPGHTTFEPLHRFPAGLYIGENLGDNFANISLGADTKLVIGHGSQKSVVVSSPSDKPSINLFGSDGKTVWSTR